MPGMTTRAAITFVSIALLPLPSIAAEAPRADKYFKITVVDRETGRGVPLVELRTVDNVRYYTDSNGVAAFFEPGLMGEEVFFYVASPGYEFPKDGFGYRGKTLKAVGGASAELKVERTNIAQRLYRITGAGIYADSLLVDQATPLAKPALNSRVVGQDGGLNTIFGGKLYWFWGDTSRPAYPLGNFGMTGATSLLPEQGGLDPEKGVDLKYFTGADGFVRPMAPLPGPGPKWLDGLVTIKDETGRERMFAAYAKIRGLLEAYERGLVEWDRDREVFNQIVTFPADATFYPGGQPFRHTDDGTSYIYFATPYPLLRVRADVESLKDFRRYEGYTCLVEGTRPSDARLDRRPDGTLRYSWKKNTAPVGPHEQARLIAAGRMKSDEALLQLQDADSHKPVLAHSGSVNWNAYRRRWIMIAEEVGGTSWLGEIWYDEAPAPIGPWKFARKIATHPDYSFYNPKQDAAFDKDNGRVIFFEGTYSTLISGNTHPTPRYDYNQLMYRLDLADPRLKLPAPAIKVDDER
jgi:hypothetical protein